MDRKWFFDLAQDKLGFEVFKRATTLHSTACFSAV
jgi:hypothetical protein